MKTKLSLLILLAGQIHFAASTRADEGYVAHEWGTFTSVQGADGIQLEWNPLIVSELPRFVYDLNKPPADPRRRLAALSGKSAFRTLQRMETPVIYFYSGKEITVDVTVKFPQGRITEWFPQARDVGPSWVQPRPVLATLDQAADRIGLGNAVNLASIDTRKGIGDSLIRWKDVRVLPQRENAELASQILRDASGSHYYAAREVDADFLRVNARVNNADKAEHEKFLFYRGVADFIAPLRVTQTGNHAESVTLQNTGNEELRHLILYTVRNGQAKYRSLEHLAPGGTASLEFKADKNLRALSEVRAEMADRLVTALAQEGLYPREAAAMVKTWDDSWFGEQGLRVLYVLPREWTDRVLPLQLEPAPKEIARVMVGRAEMLTPEMEWNLMKRIVHYIDADDAGKAKAIEEARALGLGRFMEPATRRLMGKLSSPELARYSWELLQASSKPALEGKPLAAK
jgi:hypothetical protein